MTIISSYAQAPAAAVTAAGVTFSYREYGPTGGVPVVFLIHLAGNLDNWDPRIVDPIARDHHVITFDNRGVGASDGTVPETIEAMADDAYVFITALGYDKVDLFGLSLGGMVAQTLILRHPEVVRKLILAGTGPKGGAGIENVTRTIYWDMLRGALTRSDPKEFLFFNRNRTGKSAARAFINRLKERTENRDAPISVAAFRAQLAAINNWALGPPDDLSTITHPTLIVNGDNDRMVPSPLSSELAQPIPGAELVIYPAAGHGSIFQNHEEFTPVAIRFLAG